jgi:hypothetical protein
LQVKRPALITGNALLLAFPTLAVTFQITVFEFNAGPARRLGDNRTSHLLVFSGSVSICHRGLMSQLKRMRLGGS